MNTSPLGFQRIKVIAWSVTDLARANNFYGETLALPPAYEGSEQVGYFLGQTILMLKANWYAAPTDHAPATEEALRSRGITISDPVQAYDEFYVGSFLDSEGNKLWFCSPV